MSTTTVYMHASSAETANGNSGDLGVSNYTELAVDINITVVSGTTPTCQFFVDRKDANNVYNPLWQSSSFTATGSVSTSIGAGLAYAQSLGATVKLRWVIGGASPSFAFSISIQGK